MKSINPPSCIGGTNAFLCPCVFVSKMLLLDSHLVYCCVFMFISLKPLPAGVQTFAFSAQVTMGQSRKRKAIAIAKEKEAAEAQHCSGAAARAIPVAPPRSAASAASSSTAPLPGETHDQSLRTFFPKPKPLPKQCRALASAQPAIPPRHAIKPIDASCDAYFLWQGQFVMLEFHADPVTLDRSMIALRTVCGLPRLVGRPSHDLCSAVVRCDAAAARRPPRVGQDALCVVDALAAELNDTQLEGAMCGVRQSLTIIEGPPGTGKTSASISILATWVGLARSDVARGQRTKILATAGSNGAVDNLADGLAKIGVNVVRAGRRSNIREATWRLNPKEHRMATALICAEVVCATAYGVTDDWLVDFSFDRVLVDEAGQSTEVSSLVPMSRGACQVVLVGDHRQLCPVVRSSDAQKLGMCVSLLERLVLRGMPSTLLRTQYRMSPFLSLYPSDTFYRSQVLDGVSASTRPAPSCFPWPVPGEGVCIIDVAGVADSTGHEESVEGEDGQRAIFNMVELTIVDAVVGTFLAGGVGAADVGVISPYAGQVCALKSKWKASPKERVEVATLDSYQGREKSVIVVTLVRSNESGKTGFLDDPFRQNVALTRAMNGMVVICDCRTMGRDPTWGHYLRWAEQQGYTCPAATLQM